MQVAEVLSGKPDRRAHIVFLNVHVEGIQHHLHVGAVNRTDIVETFPAGVHDVAFKPVEHFHPEDNPAVFRHFGKPLHVADRTLGVLFLIHGHGGVKRPVGVKPSAEDMNIKLLQLRENHRKESHCALYSRIVRRTEVLFLRRPVTGCQHDPVVLCALPQILEFLFGSIILGQCCTGDLQHIKTEFFYLWDIVLIVGGPFMRPVSVVNPVLHLLFFLSK